MKIKINIEKKYLMSFVVFVSLISVLFVYVQAQVPVGDVGHEGDGVWVEIGGTDKYLQDAIDAGDFGNSVSQSVVLSSCGSWDVLEWHTTFFGYPSSTGGNVWNSCGADRVISAVKSWRMDSSNPYFCNSISPSNCGEVFLIEIDCCDLSLT